jgi:hypothetical protein
VMVTVTVSASATQGITTQPPTIHFSSMALGVG